MSKKVEKVDPNSDEEEADKELTFKGNKSPLKKSNSYQTARADTFLYF